MNVSSHPLGSISNSKSFVKEPQQNNNLKQIKPISTNDLVQIKKKDLLNSGLQENKEIKNSIDIINIENSIITSNSLVQNLQDIVEGPQKQTLISPSIKIIGDDESIQKQQTDNQKEQLIAEIKNQNNETDSNESNYSKTLDETAVMEMSNKTIIHTTPTQEKKMSSPYSPFVVADLNVNILNPTTTVQRSLDDYNIKDATINPVESEAKEHNYLENSLLVKNNNKLPLDDESTDTSSIDNTQEKVSIEEEIKASINIDNIDNISHMNLDSNITNSSNITQIRGMMNESISSAQTLSVTTTPSSGAINNQGKITISENPSNGYQQEQKPKTMKTLRRSSSSFASSITNVRDENFLSKVPSTLLRNNGVSDPMVTMDNEEFIKTYSKILETVDINSRSSSVQSDDSMTNSDLVIKSQINSKKNIMDIVEESNIPITTELNNEIKKYSQSLTMTNLENEEGIATVKHIKLEDVGIQTDPLDINSEKNNVFTLINKNDHKEEIKKIDYQPTTSSEIINNSNDMNFDRLDSITFKEKKEIENVKIDVQKNNAQKQLDKIIDETKETKNVSTKEISEVLTENIKEELKKNSKQDLETNNEKTNSYDINIHKIQETKDIKINEQLVTSFDEDSFSFDEEDKDIIESVNNNIVPSRRISTLQSPNPIKNSTNSSGRVHPNMTPIMKRSYVSSAKSNPSSNGSNRASSILSVNTSNQSACSAVSAGSIFPLSGNKILRRTSSSSNSAQNKNQNGSFTFKSYDVFPTHNDIPDSMVTPTAGKEALFPNVTRFNAIKTPNINEIIEGKKRSNENPFKSRDYEQKNNYNDAPLVDILIDTNKIASDKQTFSTSVQQKTCGVPSISGINISGGLNVQNTKMEHIKQIEPCLEIKYNTNISNIRIDPISSSSNNNKNLVDRNKKTPQHKKKMQVDENADEFIMQVIGNFPLLQNNQSQTPNNKNILKSACNSNISKNSNILSTKSPIDVDFSSSILSMNRTSLVQNSQIHSKGSKLIEIQSSFQNGIVTPETNSGILRSKSSISKSSKSKRRSSSTLNISNSNGINIATFSNNPSNITNICYDRKDSKYVFTDYSSQYKRNVMAYITEDPEMKKYIKDIQNTNYPRTLAETVNKILKNDNWDMQLSGLSTLKALLISDQASENLVDTVSEDQLEESFGKICETSIFACNNLRSKLSRSAVVSIGLMFSSVHFSKYVVDKCGEQALQQMIGRAGSITGPEFMINEANSTLLSIVSAMKPQKVIQILLRNTNDKVPGTRRKSLLVASLLFEHYIVSNNDKDFDYSNNNFSDWTISDSQLDNWIKACIRGNSDPNEGVRKAARRLLYFLSKLGAKFTTSSVNEVAMKQAYDTLFAEGVPSFSLD